MKKALAAQGFEGGSWEDIELHQLGRMLKIDEKTIVELKTLLAELTQEMVPVRSSSKGKFQRAKLENESRELKQKNGFYRDSIAQNS